MDGRARAANPHATPGEGARFAAFEAALAGDGLSPGTRACYASDWWTLSERFHEFAGRPFQLERLAPAEFVRLRDDLAARGAAPSTLNRRLAFLRRYSAWAAVREPALVPVAQGFAEVPYAAVERSTHRALTHAEEQRFRAAADARGPRDAALVALLLGTGLRGAEAAALRVSDVAGRPDAPTALRVRGDRAKTVLLAGRTRARLVRLLAAERARGDAPLFRTDAGEPLGEDGVAETVDAVARDAGIEATPRTLRHTFGVRYVSEHPDDLDGLADALGHASLAAARAYRAEANSGAREMSAPVRRWDAIDESAPAEGVRRRSFDGARLSAERDLLAPDAEIAVHAHPEEQITFVLSGSVTCRVGNATVEAGAGDFVHVAPGVPHGIRNRGDRNAVLLHTYAAPRR